MDDFNYNIKKNNNKAKQIWMIVNIITGMLFFLKRDI